MVQSPVVTAAFVGAILDDIGTVNISKSNKFKSPQPQTVDVDEMSIFVTRLALSVVYPA